MEGKDKNHIATGIICTLGALALGVGFDYMYHGKGDVGFQGGYYLYVTAGFIAAATIIYATFKRKS